MITRMIMSTASSVRGQDEESGEYVDYVHQDREDDRHDGQKDSRGRWNDEDYTSVCMEWAIQWTSWNVCCFS